MCVCFVFVCVFAVLVCLFDCLCVFVCVCAFLFVAITALFAPSSWRCISFFVRHRPLCTGLTAVLRVFSFSFFVFVWCVCVCLFVCVCLLAVGNPGKTS